MLKVFIGENLWLAEKELASIKKQADPYNYVNLNGDKLTVNDLASHCQIMPFFGGNKTICVRSLLSRFDRTARESKYKSKNPIPSLVEQFADILNTLPDFCHVILIDNQVSESNALLKSLSKAQVNICESPKGQALVKHVEDVVQEKDGKIDKNAAVLLSTLAGSDMLALDNELDKLLLYVNSKTITATDIDEMCSLAKEQSIFNLVDAVIKKDGYTAEKILAQMFKNGAAPTMITHMLTRSYRIMLAISAAKDEGLKGIAVKNVADNILGAPLKPFEFNKLEELSRAYTLSRLKNIYNELLQNDIAVKSGQLDAESAISVLVCLLLAT
ncbi:MAG: DNA polymerase III subunit delta [Chloroflexi bacterium]|nr:DNA polymerase III subunit delta [Chloroflexota bacterium]